MKLWDRYRLRLKRQRWLLRAFRKRREMTSVADRTGRIGAGDVLVFMTLRNERPRLPYFLSYYRAMGVKHFLLVDNASDDGSREYLAEQPDVSLWTSAASYRSSRFGVDWTNRLLRRYGHNHWTLVLDADEFFVYPFCDTRPINALTDWMDTYLIRSFPAMVLDMYPKGAVDAVPYREGQDPFEIARWFDPGNYIISKNPQFGNLWIQGGPRARTMFAARPAEAPSLNKIPLVKWHRSYVYARSTHMLLPRGLNLTYDQWGGEKVSGCLMHAKFISTLPAKVAEEMERGEHFADSREYVAYSETMARGQDLWCTQSEEYINWRQLEILGLMSKGNWA